MKKAIVFSAIVLLLGFTACNKTDNATFRGDANIRFAPATADTRALIEDATALQAQAFKVYDDMGGTEYYIDNSIAYDATNGWAYETPASYNWKSGSHKFFGYTKGMGTLTDHVLSVEKTLTASDDEVDLLYSKIFSTTAAAWKSDASHTVETPVVLSFKHLFSAVSITLKNCTEYSVTVTSVGKPAIPNSGSADVNFGGTESAVTYGDVAVSGAFVTATSIGSTALAEGESIDVLSQAKLTSDDLHYYMVWPQTLVADAVSIAVSYTMNGATYNKTVALPADTWSAGQKYSYVLQILPTDVRLVFKVDPWDAGEAGELDTADGSINMSNVTWMNTKVDLNNNNEYGEIITEHIGPAEGDPYDKEILNENTVNNNSYSVMMFLNPKVKRTINGEDEISTWEGYYPAQGFFTVNYPTSGQYKIGLIPAWGESSVDETMYEISVWKKVDDAFEWVSNEDNPSEYIDDITHDTIYFKVSASSSVPASHDEIKAQLDIWFKPDGSDEWISAYSEIRANYALTIPKTN